MQVVFDKNAVSYWNEMKDTWTVERGFYKQLSLKLIRVANLAIVFLWSNI